MTTTVSHGLKYWTMRPMPLPDSNSSPSLLCCLSISSRLTRFYTSLQLLHSSNLTLDLNFEPNRTVPLLVLKASAPSNCGDISCTTFKSLRICSFCVFTNVCTLSILDVSTSDVDVALVIGGVKCLVRALEFEATKDIFDQIAIVLS